MTIHKLNHKMCVKYAIIIIFEWSVSSYIKYTFKVCAQLHILLILNVPYKITFCQLVYASFYLIVDEVELITNTRI